MAVGLLFDILDATLTISVQSLLLHCLFDTTTSAFSCQFLALPTTFRLFVLIRSFPRSLIERIPRIHLNRHIHTYTFIYIYRIRSM